MSAPATITRQQAAQEILIRRRARADVLQYANAIDVPGRPVDENDDETEYFRPVETVMAEHHRLILTTADRISRMRHGRAMFFLPPGSAKSTYASVVFPSLYLGRERDRRIILATYGEKLARKMGRRTRSIIKQPRYAGIWGTTIAQGSGAADDFILENGSEYMAGGFDSGITGNRGHGIIIDDPIKGRKEAESPTVRDTTWDTYQDDLLTRLIPGGWVLLIQTRWNPDDVAGRILPEKWKGESGPILCRDGNVWEVVCLQARCEVENDPLGRKKGEYLWPDWFDKKHWDQFEANPRTWASLCQQIPNPKEGNIFKPDQIQIVDAIPAQPVKWCRGWDFAATTDGGDFTAAPRLGKLADGRYIIADMFREQYGPDDRDRALLATASQDGKGVLISLPQDPGQAGKSQILYLTRLLAGYRVHTSPESGKKELRAEPFASQVNVGNVIMLRGHWNQKALDEMRDFPNGKTDDQVDGLSRAFSALLEAKVELAFGAI